MRAEKYKKSYLDYAREAMNSRLIIAALIAVCGLLAWTNMQAEQPAVVLQPWTLTETARVAQDNAEPVYYEAWGLALATLVGNINADSIDTVVSSIVPILHPDIRREYQASMRGEAEEMGNNNIDISFVPQVTEFQRRSDGATVFVKGTQTQQTRISDPISRPYVYEFYMQIQDFRIVIRDIKSYEANE